MKNKLILGLVMLSILSSFVFASDNAPPPIPTEYWGEALIDGEEASVGTPITSVYGDTTVAADGDYDIILTGGDSDLTFLDDSTCATHWAADEACIPCSTNPVDEDYCVEGPQAGDIVTINFDGNPVDVVWGDDKGAEETDLASITLESGYNLVSLPIVPINITLPAPLSSIDGNYEIVWAYKASDPGDPWKKFVPGVPAFLYDLHDMEPSLGYWIKMSTNGVLAFAGKNVNVAGYQQYKNIPLYTGYNLISMYYIDGKNYTLPAPISSIDGNYEIVWAYKASDPGDPWKKFVPGVPAFLYDLHDMEPTYGYWVKMTDNDNLIVE